MPLENQNMFTHLFIHIPPIPLCLVPKVFDQKIHFPRLLIMERVLRPSDGILISWNNKVKKKNKEEEHEKSF